MKKGVTNMFSCNFRFQRWLFNRMFNGLSMSNSFLSIPRVLRSV